MSFMKLHNDGKTEIVLPNYNELGIINEIEKKVLYNRKKVL